MLPFPPCSNENLFHHGGDCFSCSLISDNLLFPLTSLVLLKFEVEKFYFLLTDGFKPFSLSPTSEVHVIRLKHLLALFVATLYRWHPPTPGPFFTLWRSPLSFPAMRGGFSVCMDDHVILCSTTAFHSHNHTLILSLSIIVSPLYHIPFWSQSLTFLLLSSNALNPTIIYHTETYNTLVWSSSHYPLMPILLLLSFLSV